MIRSTDTGHIDDQTILRVADEIVWVEVDGETVAYDGRRKKVHLLNPTASLVWSAIDGRATIGSIAGKLRESFRQEDDGTIPSDVLRLGRELAGLGLLVPATRRR